MMNKISSSFFLSIFIAVSLFLKKKESNFEPISDLKKFSRSFPLICKIELLLNVGATTRNLWSSLKPLLSLKDISDNFLVKICIQRVSKNFHKVGSRYTFFRINLRLQWKKLLKWQSKLIFFLRCLTIFIAKWWQCGNLSSGETGSFIAKTNQLE